LIGKIEINVNVRAEEATAIAISTGVRGMFN